MARKKPFNPFYWALVFVGVAFGITACAYAWGSRLRLDPATFARNEDFISMLDRYGMVILVVELGLLTVLTFLAIGTDDYWMKSPKSDTPSEDAK